ncbi:MAG TPA: lipid II flippase MurJ [Ktedonobacteraceae bacterium]|nr:lipid II flippase MurJ [Ktedonobacteraceae bacterium]
MPKDATDKTPSESSTIEPLPVATAGIPVPEAEPALDLIVQMEPARPSERREIVKSASLVMLGNLGSSVLGMVRQIVVTGLGRTIAGPFNSALSPAQTFNDFLINGSVPGALIPTFNDYSAPEKRDELRRLVFTIVNLVALVMLAASILFLFVSPWFVNDFFVSGYTPAGKALTLQYAQIVFFSLVALGPFAVLLAALYSLKEFGWPAFATASYHVGIIIGAIVGSFIGAHYYGYLGLAFGVLLGAAGEIALLLPGIFNQRLKYMFVLDLKHPALRRILKLYAPVAFSFLVSMGLVFLDQHLASATPCASFVHKVKACGEANFTAMRAATTLIQFPIGLVAAALSFAVLPTLSTHVREGNDEQFKETLLLGIRLGLLLMIPAAAGLIVLQHPIVNLLFRHGKYTPEDTLLVATALQNYAYQLPFVAIDQLLIAAFYARKNTIIPVTVGFVSTLGYLVVALPFSQTIGMPALAFANTVQNSSHAIILLVLLRLAIGSIHVRKMIPAILKILVATAAMIALAWGLQVVLGAVSLFSANTLLGQLLTVVLVGGLASGVYVGGVLLLKVEEVGLLKGAVLAKLGKK